MPSEEMISRVARIVDGILCRDPDIALAMFGDEPDRIARTLAQAGLLAPATLRQEGAYEIPDVRDYEISAEDDMHALAQSYGWVEKRRWVSDWEPVDSDEGDGSADQ